MKLLVIGDIGIIFTYEYITRVAAKFPDCKTDVLSFCPKNPKNSEREKALNDLGCKIFYQPAYSVLRKVKLFHPLLRVAEAVRYRICKKYDVVNMHFIGIDSWAVPHYVSHDKRVIASVYGSDLLRADKAMLSVLDKVFKRADAITVASKYVRQVISEKFNRQYDDKVKTARYGSDAADFMHRSMETLNKDRCKKENGLPTDKTVILCGYNGSPTQRHLEIIEELKKLPEEYKKQVFLLFQCSYGSAPSYLEKIAESLKNSGFDGKIETEFMQGETLAKFRKSVDLLLNLQPTDVLSATMIEELEAGALVLKGDWLLYPDLDERNAYILSVDKMENLSVKVQSIFEGYSECVCEAKRNNGIWKILSWEDELPTWKRIIFGE